MANQSLIADLLKTPSQIRKEREERLLTEGLAQAQLFNQGNRLGGVGGMFAGFGAAQAANVGRGMDQAVTALRDAASSATGQDFRRGEERLAGEAQSIMRGVDTNNPQSMLAAANKLATINPRASEALRQRAQTLQASQAKAKSEDELNELRVQKLRAEINRLNTPEQMSAKDRANLAKDFTSASVAEYLETGNVNDLQYRVDPAKSNYVVLKQQTGVDRNGVPTFNEYLVDKSQVADITGGSAVVSVGDLTRGQQPSPSTSQTTAVTPPPQLTAEKINDDISISSFSTKVQEMLNQAGVTEGTGLDIPPVPGFKPKENVEARYDGLRDVSQAETLIRDVFSQDFEDVAGVTNWVKRKAEWATDGRLAPMGARMEKGAIQRAIAAAKLLGVNPTDKDFRKTMESAPTGNDGVSVWQDWTENSFIPELLDKLESEHGKDSQIYKGTKAYLDDLIEEVKTTEEEPKVVNWNEM